MIKEITNINHNVLVLNGYGDYGDFDEALKMSSDELQ